ncbi:hypothetical protein C4577_02540 [Candidatus Parcubacteria bacterium]|nr:MAG: hypothetical protein C4577_02540 [Candidatus Parcubacteria bacterium]
MVEIISRTVSEKCKGCKTSYRCPIDRTFRDLRSLGIDETEVEGIVASNGLVPREGQNGIILVADCFMGSDNGSSGEPCGTITIINNKPPQNQ